MFMFILMKKIKYVHLINVHLQYHQNSLSYNHQCIPAAFDITTQNFAQ